MTEDDIKKLATHVAAAAALAYLEEHKAELQGPAGPEGKPGRSGAPGPEGRGYNDRGTFNLGETYRQGDVVAFDGGSYSCRVPETKEPPGSSDWQTLSKRGDRGRRGPAGPPGRDGADGRSMAMRRRGDWKRGESYENGDLVRDASEGASYACCAEPGQATKSRPSENSVYWQLLARDGTPPETVEEPETEETETETES